MKFSIKKNDIIDILSNIQGITNRKSNLAITETILIQSNNSEITITATNLETGFEGNYPAAIESGGVITINSKKLFEIVRNFPDDTIQIEEIENRRLKIGNQNIEYNIVGMNPDDFPEIPQIDDIQFFNLNSADFKKMIEQSVMVTPLTSEEKREHIIGVNLECIDAENEIIIRMVSTDGKRLTKTDYFYFDQKLGLPLGESIIIPKKGLNEVGKFLETEGLVQVGMQDNNFIVKKENETVIISLLEGDFPSFDDIMSVGEDIIIELDKESFKMMLRRMSILTSDEYKGVYFQFNDDKLVIKTANPDIGESKEEMVIQYKEQPIEVAFNPQFFIDALNFIESDTVYLNIRDEEHPCLVQGEEDKSFVSIIMPMKI